MTSVYPGTDLTDRLVTGLTELTNESRESVSRKVHNWVKGQHVPQNRETLFQICFLPRLTEENISYVLATSSETGTHYRNPSELIYAFALYTGRSYPDAVLLKKKLLSLLEPMK